MLLEEFRSRALLDGKRELDRAKLLAFYHATHRGTRQFSAQTVRRWFTTAGFAAPNASRLARAMRGSREFLRVGEKEFRLSASCMDETSKKFPLDPRSDEVVVLSGEILPPQLYENSRGYLEALGRQINRSYSENLFDACAVLMRRLLEILLILAFRHHEEEALIEQEGTHVSLERIIALAKTSPKLKLSRNTRSSLDDFRTLGNFAAHKIEYTTRRGDVDKVRIEYRGTVEELFYKAGIRS